MSLIGNLLSNANALNVHTLGVQTAGNNIANVNDPAYARQRVMLRDSGNYKIGTSVQQRGIEALGIEHIRNSVLDSQLMREEMLSSSVGTQSDLLAQVEASINDIISRQDLVDSLDGNKSENLDSGGIATALDDFLNTFAELASAPGDESIKSVLFERAQVLVDQFNLADERLIELDDYMGDRIYDEVEVVNDLLGEIAGLNQKIAQFEAQQGTMAPDLRDQRQESLEELAQYIDFETAVSGINPAMLDVKVRNSTGSGNFTTVISGGSVTGEIAYEEFDTAGSPTNRMLFRDLTTSTDVVLNIKGGSIGGALTVKTNNLVQLQYDFDTLAKSVVENVNNAYRGSEAPAISYPATGTAPSLIKGNTYTIGTAPDGTLDFTTLGAAANTAGTQFVYNGASTAAWNAGNAAELTPSSFFATTGVDASTIAIDSTLIATQTVGGQTYTYFDADKLKTSNNPDGGNEVATAVGNLVDSKTISGSATTLTFREYIAQFSSRVGAEVENAETAVENQQAVTDFLTTQRESYSGVNMDEEMTDLLRFQRAFQGTSRVISTLDQMLQQVVAGLIR